MTLNPILITHWNGNEKRRREVFNKFHVIIYTKLSHQDMKHYAWIEKYVTWKSSFFNVSASDKFEKDRVGDTELYSNFVSLTYQKTIQSCFTVTSKKFASLLEKYYWKIFSSPCKISPVTENNRTMIIVTQCSFPVMTTVLDFVNTLISREAGAAASV